jgi:hypothetical protein
MKKLVIIFSGIFFLIPCMQSQILLGLKPIIEENKNIPETTNQLRYYFYPNLDAYFDLKNSNFIYVQLGNWITNGEIPSNYRGYSLYNNYRVEIKDYFGETPYINLNENRKNFPQDYRGRRAKIEADKNKTINKSLTNK